MAADRQRGRAAAVLQMPVQLPAEHWPAARRQVFCTIARVVVRELAEVVGPASCRQDQQAAIWPEAVGQANYRRDRVEATWQAAAIGLA